MAWEYGTDFVVLPSHPEIEKWDDGTIAIGVDYKHQKKGTPSEIVYNNEIYVKGRSIATIPRDQMAVCRCHLFVIDRPFGTPKEKKDNRSDQEFLEFLK